MILKIELPHVGESVTEAEIGEWLKSAGDSIEKYESIVEIVTDKVSMELPAPAAGVLTKIISEEGETVPMGAIIAEMDTSEISESEPTESFDMPASNRIGTLIQGANVGPTGGEFLDTSMDSATPEVQPKETKGSVSKGNNKRYSPVVVRLASKHGIDLDSIKGTGSGARVTKKDVLAAIESGETSVASVYGVAPGDEVIKPTAVRRMIADRMARSTSEIPHAWSAIEVDVTGLVALRTANKESFEKEHGVPLTYLPIALFAVAGALKSNPYINSSWVDGNIILKSAINVGVAVATDGGLVVPVIKNAEGASIPDLARQLDQMIDRARNGNMTLEDASGSTFTLNNTGALGSIWSGAIINHPQAAILTIEAIIKRPVVVTNKNEDSVEIRSMINLCLSFDHRIIDGAEASRFLQAVKKQLESIDEFCSLED
tara:strand:+ start:2102 stop:3394 length:1293 start_codon:yes stop_codon:yes gene_type:complete